MRVQTVRHWESILEPVLFLSSPFEFPNASPPTPKNSKPRRVVTGTYNMPHIINVMEETGYCLDSSRVGMIQRVNIWYNLKLHSASIRDKHPSPSSFTHSKTQPRTTPLPPTSGCNITLVSQNSNKLLRFSRKAGRKRASGALGGRGGIKVWLIGGWRKERNKSRLLMRQT